MTTSAPIAQSGVVAAALSRVENSTMRRPAHNSSDLGRAVDKLRGTEERLEMNRQSTEAERQARDLPDEEARREAMKWARR